ncbi:potassium transporter Trk [Anaerococcus sp. HMSC075B03]|uniref:Trk system potassium uptake protein TrkA n=1 Tax=Anaerococcus obesiensis TaxID=1287640 RepID=A0A7T7UV17_9FIRM|nr:MULTISPECIES: Trk system potassium transporter TrkA [Anaerococcus]MBS6921855.1 Trk system potassium transporter TrkA [Anaerococcus vaginalis]MDU5461084.1 Trk system potassium transporter TrkA [Anaerococcus vaginalis]MDU6546847.1 Trk system potassium transporter TrkA [Anaerococcus vaginalis]OFJ70920.1 potassium transporter Trk [Anaerococcus sp. HMSC065G05]OFO42361.1 potassium transporter Trk [Anaerococcus sp. HMSC075B03]
MNVIIVGAGKVGSYLTSKLSDEGHNILVIEKNKDVLERLLASNDVMGILGDGRDLAVLDEANVDECDAFIAMTFNDDVNLISSMIAKKKGAKSTIVRLRDPRYIKYDEFMRKTMGVDRLVNPEYYAAKEIQRTLKYTYAVNVENFLDSKVILIELEIDENSKLANKSLMDLNAEGLLGNTIIVIGEKDDQVVIPNGNHILEVGEKIYVAGPREDIDKFYKRQVDNKKSIKNVLIIGGGSIALNLSELLLKRNFNVTVLEIDKERAIDFSERLPECEVINADGSDPEILDEVRIENYDAVVALTGIDEENILISLLAKKRGIDKIIAKVNRTQLLKITGILDVDTTVTPKKSASFFVSRLLRSKENSRGESISNLFRLSDDRVEAIDFTVIENSRVTGKKLKDLNVKANTLIVGISRQNLGGKIEVANGESTIELGDRVMVVTKNKDFKEIDDILE